MEKRKIMRRKEVKEGGEKTIDGDEVSRACLWVSVSIIQHKKQNRTEQNVHARKTNFRST